jgi:hypothetical protein
MSNPTARRALAMLLLLGGCTGCFNSWQPSTLEHPTVRLSAEEVTNGWVPLFDGASLIGWRIYHGGAPTSGWQVQDGAIVRVAGPGVGDLVTDRTFGNFDLKLDWKVAPGGNSGIIYRVDDSGDATYMTGPEMQVLDDERHLDGRSELTSAGAVYGLYPAPRGIVKPAGEWNEARILANGNHVEHWLNGTRIAEYELGSAEWAQKVAASKFDAWKGYGKFARGRIALQDHGDVVAYRNIRIKELP